MIDQLSTVTSTAVSVALDALVQRQQLIAANLANANSVASTVHRLKFEEAFSRVLDGMTTDGPEALQALLQIKHDLRDGTLVTRDPAQSVQTDAEMVRLNETVIRYQALIEGLGKYASLTHMAISGEVKG